jgi:hypothetical protein
VDFAFGVSYEKFVFGSSALTLHCGVEMRQNVKTWITLWQGRVLWTGSNAIWLKSSLVRGGVPLAMGTRIPAEQIVEESELGSHADSHKSQPVP